MNDWGSALLRYAVLTSSPYLNVLSRILRAVRLALHLPQSFIKLAPRT
jgi:hypothetical protein